MGDFAKVGVLGAGVMGSGIAAHIANAGVPVVLLDVVPDGAADRGVLARSAIERLLKTDPAPLMHKRNARLITPGNLEDDLGLLSDCDWICEAVLEDLDVKQQTYRAVNAVRKAGSIVTSNTSTIPLHTLIAGLPETFARDFAVTHFFNPPRYMRLLELVGGPLTRSEALAQLKDFADRRLGKDVVAAKDTPGFIANRIGIYWSYVAMAEAMARGLSIEEADAIVGRPMGIPKTGIFGLLDLTGIDLAPRVNESMLRLLPDNDAFKRDFDAKGPLVALIADLIAQGRTGRKAGAGFYRRGTQDGAYVKEAIDFDTGDYRPVRRVTLQSPRAGRKGLRALVEHPDRGGQYAWAVLSKVLTYAATLAPEIADDIAAVDRAMKSGYAWKHGPFEQIDQLGAAWFAERLAEEGRPVPPLIATAGERPFYREEGEQSFYLTAAGEYAERAAPSDAWRLADKKRGHQPVERNGSASLWDIGDGVACLELHSKMNAIDGDTIALLVKAAQLHKQGYRALIIGSDGDAFSVGANLGLALFAANTAMWPVIEQTVTALQNAVLGLKYAPFPVVAAVNGLALGGGCEIALHCDAVQAHGESYMGLVEAGVGVIPAGGGTKELLTRWYRNKRRPGGPMPPIAKTFETIALAQVGRSAAESRDLLFLGDDDGVTMNRDRLLADAKARALALADGYAPPEPAELNLPGPAAKAAVSLVVDGFVAQGKASPHDALVAMALADVVSGADTDIVDTVSEQTLLRLERQAFMSLIRTGPTLARIEHTLDTGRPLRN